MDGMGEKSNKQIIRHTVFSWHYAAKPYQEAICKIHKIILKIAKRSKHLWENNADKTLRGELHHAGHRNLCPLWLLSGSAACPPRTSLVGKSSTLNSGKLQFTPKHPPSNQLLICWSLSTFWLFTQMILTPLLMDNSRCGYLRNFGAKDP